MKKVRCPQLTGRPSIAPGLPSGVSWANVTDTIGKYACCNCGGDHNIVGSSSKSMKVKKSKKQLRKEQQQKNKKSRR